MEYRLPLLFSIIYLVIMLSCANSQTSTSLSMKIAEIYDQNDNYILFSTKKPDNSSDQRLWIKNKKTNFTKVIQRFSSNGSSSWVHDAVLKNKLPIAYATVSLENKIKGYDDQIFELNLETGRSKSVFLGEKYKVSFLTDGNQLIISSDGKYLAFIGNMLPMKLVDPGPNYPEQQLLRFGSLAANRPTLTVVPNGSKVWPCTSSLGEIVLCK